MQRFLLGTFFGLTLTAGSQAVAGQIPPNMIYDCGQPRLASLSKELGRTVCVQYDMIQNMATVAPAVEAAARAFVHHSIKVAASAEPETISCREHDVAFRPPSLICAHNSEWNQHWPRGDGFVQLQPYYNRDAGPPPP